MPDAPAARGAAGPRCPPVGGGLYQIRVVAGSAWLPFCLRSLTDAVQNPNIRASMTHSHCMATGWQGVDAAIGPATVWGGQRGIGPPRERAAADLRMWQQTRGREGACGLSTRGQPPEMTPPGMTPPGGMAPGAIDGRNTAGTMAGQAAGMAGGLVVAGVHEFIGDAGPPLGLLARLAGRLVATSHRVGSAGNGDTVAWVGRRVWPDVLAMARLGASSGVNLPSVSLFVDPADAAARWWAAERSVRSGAACCVVMDATGACLTVTRRLHLAAVDAGVTVLLVRDAAEASRPSAAMTRWRVRRLKPDASRGGSQRTRWNLDLLRCKGRQAFNPSGDVDAVRRAHGDMLASWILEWDHVHGPVDFSTELVDRSDREATAAARWRSAVAADHGRAPHRRSADCGERVPSMSGMRRARRHDAGRSV